MYLCTHNSLVAACLTLFPLVFQGGVGDYSGSMVLEVATHVATTVSAEVSPSASDEIVMTSEPFGTTSLPLTPLRDAVNAGTFASINLPDITAFLKAQGAPFWTYYVFGSVAVFVRETGWLPPLGEQIRLEISSDVPTAQGVSSSASIEVAVIRALRKLSGKELTELRTAHIAQNAENFVVGAPCGLMDQLASACGAAGKVLPILCRPDILSDPVPLPGTVTLVGWPSGVKHSVAGISPYLVARTATFMAKKMAEKILGRKLDFFTQLDVYTLHTKVLPALPETISGKDFLEAYGPLEDGLSSLQPETVYAVKASATFPVEENFRCGLAASLLAAAARVETGSPEYASLLTQVGDLMGLTHSGYTAIGLGCEETDAMVDKLRSMGPAQGIYGARIAGGGSGGTVAVLLERSALPTLEALAKEMVFDAPFTGLIQ